jgi:putative FmdB family regulatory protein
VEGFVPTYQYACTACGHQLEAVQSFTDEALTECPACEGRLRKLFSAVGIVFKGSGFYRTDSRGKSGESKPRAESSTSESKSDSTSESKSESTGSASSDPVKSGPGGTSGKSESSSTKSDSSSSSKSAAPA